MTSRPPSRLRPGRLISSGVQRQLPARPLLTTPAHLQHRAFADLQRQRLAAQPWLGMGGLLLGAVEWITTAGLSFIGAGIILHVGIGLRWPFALKTGRSSQIP